MLHIIPEVFHLKGIFKRNFFETMSWTQHSHIYIKNTGCQDSRRMKFRSTKSKDSPLLRQQF